MKIGWLVLGVLLGGSVWGCSEPEPPREKVEEMGSGREEVDERGELEWEDDHWVTRHQAL